MKLKTFKTIVFGIGATLLLCSCQKEFKYMHAGDDIRFTAGSGFVQTKASYSGATTSAGTIERIDWQEGDLLRIYCAQASEPAVLYADYQVTSVDSPVTGSPVSTAHIETFSNATDGVGLRWGSGDHTFYAVFPSPATTGGITTSISGSEVSANLSAVQAPASVTGSGVNYTAVADLKNMLMTAKAGPYTAETFPDGDHVFLPFTPLTTAVKFTITNQSKAALTIKSVSLISASSALNGPFTVDIDDASYPESVNLGSTTVTYSRTYPYCQYTGTVSDATKKVTINFATPVTLPYDADIAKCGTLTFTFFLQPCQNFNDLTFKLVKSDDSWMKTKLGYTDVTGILFPRFKKTTVTGILVPEGAQWTVKYAPTVQSWDTYTDDINPMPETDGDPLVTSWDTGIDEELTLMDQYNGHEYVEIDGIKWATCNVGATSPKEYGWYFSWAGTTGYVRDGSKWVTEQGGSELSGGFCWANTPYHTGSIETANWEKYIPTGRETYCSGGGSPDNKFSLELVDDAARANWGGSWRMPTQAEFQKLYEACGGTGTFVGTPALPSANPGKGIYWVSNSQTYISDYNGVAGILFCDGVNKLFFVAAGYGNNGDTFSGAGSEGRYWSGNVFSTNPQNAYRLGFQSGNVSVVNVNGRNQGFPVRPVSD